MSNMNNCGLKVLTSLLLWSRTPVNHKGQQIKQQEELRVLCIGVRREGRGLSKLLVCLGVDDPVRKAWDTAEVACVLWFDGGS